jgi:hypothetical protein
MDLSRFKQYADPPSVIGWFGTDLQAKHPSGRAWLCLRDRNGSRTEEHTGELSEIFQRCSTFFSQCPRLLARYEPYHQDGVVCILLGYCARPPSECGEKCARYYEFPRATVMLTKEGHGYVEVDKAISA